MKKPQYSHSCSDPPTPLYWPQRKCQNCKVRIIWTSLKDAIADNAAELGTGWYQVPHSFRMIAGIIGPYAIAVYHNLLDHANHKEDDLAWPSINTIALETGISHAQVLEMLNLLETIQLVELIRQSRRLGNQYRPVSALDWLAIHNLVALPEAVTRWRVQRTAEKNARKAAALKAAALAGRKPKPKRVRVVAR